VYEEFYQFERTPFSATPDPSFLYTSPAHREALAALIYGVQYRKGFIALIGEVGTGKTTVLRSYIHSKYAKNVKLIYVFNPKLNFSELLTVILREFTSEIPATEVEKADLLHRYLVAYYEKNINVVIVIDEAQNTPTDTLESMRMLSNIETTRHKMVQIILAGQPELEELLSSHDLRQLRQRLSLTVRLRPLTQQESAAYIAHRIKRAGAPEGLFTAAALEWIVAHAEGIPRKINMICDNALVTGFGAGENQIGIEILHEISADLRLQGIDALDGVNLAARSNDRIKSISVVASEDETATTASIGKTVSRQRKTQDKSSGRAPEAKAAGEADSKQSKEEGAPGRTVQRPVAVSSDAPAVDENREGDAESWPVLTQSKPAASSDAAETKVESTIESIKDSKNGVSAAVVNGAEAKTLASDSDTVVKSGVEADDGGEPVVRQTVDEQSVAALTAEYLDFESAINPEMRKLAVPRSTPGGSGESQVLMLGEAQSSKQSGSTPESSGNHEPSGRNPVSGSDTGAETQNSTSTPSGVKKFEQFFSNLDSLQADSASTTDSSREPNLYSENNRALTSDPATPTAERQGNRDTMSATESQTERAADVDPVSYVLANRKKQSRTFKKFKKFW